MKKTFYSEAAYVLGIVILAFGTAMMERSDFGLSMVVAPAYLIHLKVSQYLPWFTFGVAEYCLQAVLIVLLSLVLHGFRLRYLFSFVTAFIYGNVLDLAMTLIALIPGDGIALRAVFFIVGLLIDALSIALLFHTYIAPEAYELFVKEISAKYNKKISVVKTVYDCCSCLVAIIMSFAFFGLWHFEGIRLGTVFCALVNGFLIGKCGDLLEKHFEFKDASAAFAKYFRE